MIPVTSQRVIEIIRDEICNPDLNAEFIGYKLDCSQPSIWKCVKEDFNTSPYKLILNIRCHKILKYTYDHRAKIYKSAAIYGIGKPDTFIKMVKKKFNKTPCQIEYEIAIDENRKQNYYRYHRELMIHGLLL
jgi:AraC-like DNA-binding protein